MYKYMQLEWSIGKIGNKNFHIEMIDLDSLFVCNINGSTCNKFEFCLYYSDSYIGVFEFTGIIHTGDSCFSL